MWSYILKTNSVFCQGNICNILLLVCRHCTFPNWNELILSHICTVSPIIMLQFIDRQFYRMVISHYLCTTLYPAVPHSHSLYSSATQQILWSNLGHHNRFSLSWCGFSLGCLPTVSPGFRRDSRIPIPTLPCTSNVCAHTFLYLQNFPNFSMFLLLPSGLSSCASVGVPSTYQSAASGCRCERWNLCAWLLPPAADRWRCSSSSAHMSAASWPSAHPVYRIGLEVPLPAGQTLWEIICKTYTGIQRHKHRCWYTCTKCNLTGHGITDHLGKLCIQPLAHTLGWWKVYMTSISEFCCRCTHIYSKESQNW